jgi:hypothetical protein
MPEQFETVLERERTISGSRALVPYVAPGEEPPEPEQARVNAAFLATLIAQTVQAETARRRRRSSPDVAISHYRAGEALADLSPLTRLRSL